MQQFVDEKHRNREIFRVRGNQLASSCSCLEEFCFGFVKQRLSTAPMQCVKYCMRKRLYARTVGAPDEFRIRF